MIRFILGTILIAVLVYGGVEAAPLIAGPAIDLTSPLPQDTIPDGAVVLSGTAKRAESLSLNGGPLLIDEHGMFGKELTLPKGGTVLSLIATDRFGRTDQVTRTVYIP